MNIAGVQFNEDECEEIEELASEDLAVTLMIAGEEDSALLWEAVEDSYRLLYRAIHREPSACDVAILIDLADAYGDHDLAGRLDEAYARL